MGDTELLYIYIYVYIYTVHTSYNLNVTCVVYAEATRVAHACFCQKHAMTRATNYLRVQGYTRLQHLFTCKVEFYTHTRVLAVIAIRS